MVQGGSAHIRFQPRLGKYLAAAEDYAVSVLDVETQACLHLLQVSLKFSVIYINPGR